MPLPMSAETSEIDGRHTRTNGSGVADGDGATDATEGATGVVDEEGEGVIVKVTLDTTGRTVINWEGCWP